MNYVRFRKDVYEFIDEDERILFSIDNTHSDLFNYITKDISYLPQLFEHYVLQRLDITTLKLKDCQKDENDLYKIKEILKSIHCYYNDESLCENIIIWEIGKYINSLLLYSEKYEIEKEEYFKIITQLMPSSISNFYNYPEGLFPDDFYNQYKNLIGDHERPDENEYETFVFGTPSQMPKGFLNEINTQRMIYDMLYFILDISAKGMEMLTTHQRVWLYGNISQKANYNSDISVKKRPAFWPLSAYKEGNDYTKNKKLYDIFSPLYGLSCLEVEHNGIPANISESFNTALAYAKEVNENEYYEEYEITNLRELLYLEIEFMIKSDVKIKKCKNCGKYFVVANRKMAYCNRIIKNGIRCSDIGSKQTFEKKKKEEPELKMYDRAYKTHYARYMKKKMTWPEFESWVKEAKEKLAQVRYKELDISEFQQWLKI